MLSVAGTGVSDLAPLAKLKHLHVLFLWRTPVRDLTPLRALGELWVLHLSDTAVQDLTPLAKLGALTRMFLFRTEVVDLTPLENLSALEVLWIGDNSRITGEEVRRFNAARRSAGLREVEVNPKVAKSE